MSRPTYAVVSLTLLLAGCGATQHQAASNSAPAVEAPGVPAPDADGVITYARGVTSASADQNATTKISRDDAAQLADERAASDPAMYPPGYSLELRTFTSGNFDEPGVPRLTWIATFPGSAHVPLSGPAGLSAADRADMMTAQCSAVLTIDAETGEVGNFWQFRGPTAQGRKKRAEQSPQANG
jgi:hypothetical protein